MGNKIIKPSNPFHDFEVKTLKIIHLKQKAGPLPVLLVGFF